MKEKRGTVVTLTVIVVVLALAGGVTYKVIQNAKEREAARDFASALTASDVTPYTDLEGNPLSFDQYKGKVRVVGTWASWCPTCVSQLQYLEKIAQAYPQDDVVVIGVNRMETKEKARRFLKTIGTFEELIFAVDLTDAFYKQTGGYAMPEMVFYDAKGNIVKHTREELTYEQIDDYLQHAINTRTD